MCITLEGIWQRGREGKVGMGRSGEGEGEVGRVRAFTAQIRALEEYWHFWVPLGCNYKGKKGAPFEH